MIKKPNVRVLETDGGIHSVKNMGDTPVFINGDAETGFPIEPGGVIEFAGRMIAAEMSITAPDYVLLEDVLKLLQMDKTELAVILTGEEETDRKLAQAILRRDK